jgi:hypothetical protein
MALVVASLHVLGFAILIAVAGPRIRTSGPRAP